MCDQVYRDGLKPVPASSTNAQLTAAAALASRAAAAAASPEAIAAVAFSSSGSQPESTSRRAKLFEVCAKRFAFGGFQRRLRSSEKG